jgi:hypothetical protein
MEKEKNIARKVYHRNVEFALEKVENVDFGKTVHVEGCSNWQKIQDDAYYFLHPVEKMVREIGLLVEKNIDDEIKK